MEGIFSLSFLPFLFLFFNLNFTSEEINVDMNMADNWWDQDLHSGNPLELACCVPAGINNEKVANAECNHKKIFSGKETL